MAKRGRKPKERKGYFYEEQEQAVKDYKNTDNEAVRNKIFSTILYPAFTKMIESIIRRYKLFIPDEDFNDNFNDTMSYLSSKLKLYRPVITLYDEIKEYDVVSEIGEENFYEITSEDFKEKKRNAEINDPELIKVSFRKKKKSEEVSYKFYQKRIKEYKAYSYFGTICKNYLCCKSKQFVNKRQKNLQYEDVFEELSNSTRYIEEDSKSISEIMFQKITDEIQVMVDSPDEYNLSDNEVKVGHALIELFMNWDKVLQDDDTNKLQKSSILYFLREETLMNTKELRDNMKKFKNVYWVLKKATIDE